MKTKIYICESLGIAFPLVFQRPDKLSIWPTLEAKTKKKKDTLMASIMEGLIKSDGYCSFSLTTLKLLVVLMYIG